MDVRHAATRVWWPRRLLTLQLRPILHERRVQIGRGLPNGGPGGKPPACAKAADANDDNALNIADAVKILGFLFSTHHGVWK